MADAKTMLIRQARWQHERTEQSWAGKIRMAERVRDGVKALKKSGKPHSTKVR